MRSATKIFALSLISLIVAQTESFAQEGGSTTVEQELIGQIDQSVLSNSYLKDLNGDGAILIDAFGDSITRGRGDFIAPNQDITETTVPDSEAGYPLRIEMLLGFSVLNKGLSGDRVFERGVERFASVIPGSSSDLVIISGGSNDAFSLTSSLDLSKSVQTMINIAAASGKQPMLATIPPTCCDRSGINLFIMEYNRQYEHLAAINEIPLAQVNKAFVNTCNLPTCNLLNRPEGLHPNSKGYDVQGEAVIAALLKINLLSPEGPAAYEAALGLQPGSVVTVPNSTSSVETTPATGDSVGQI